MFNALKNIVVGGLIVFGLLVIPYIVLPLAVIAAIGSFARAGGAK